MRRKGRNLKESERGREEEERGRRKEGREEEREEEERRRGGKKERGCSSAAWEGLRPWSRCGKPPRLQPVQSDKCKEGDKEEATDLAHIMHFTYSMFEPDAAAALLGAARHCVVMRGVEAWGIIRLR